MSRHRHFALSLLAFGLAASAACRRVPPDAIGIRTINVGSEKGIVQKDFDAGLYRSIWLVESWDTLPRSVQRVLFSNRSEQRTADDAPAIVARTIDGDAVTVEAAVLFRIADGKGHFVYRDSGPGDEFKRRARELAGPQIASAFATLKTESIYKEKERRKALDDLETMLKKMLLDQKGIELVDVAITNLVFEPKYEEQLEKTKVNRQKELLEVSLQERAKQQGVKDAIVQETDNKVKQIQIDRTNRVREIAANNKREVQTIDATALRTAEGHRAEGVQYRAEKEAEGTRAVKEAEAYAIDLQQKALGSAGANYVAYQTALNYPVRSVQMSSIGIDWLNPMSLAEHVGAILQASSSGAAQKPSK